MVWTSLKAGILGTYLPERRSIRDWQASSRPFSVDQIARCGASGPSCGRDNLSDLEVEEMAVGTGPGSLLSSWKSQQGSLK